MIKSLVVGIGIVLVAIWMFTGITPVQVVGGLLRMGSLLLAGIL